METSHNPYNPLNLPASPPLVMAAPVPDAVEGLSIGRLGAYAGLFLALRMKHPPTAAHSMRVAMTCSKWAAWRGMVEEEMSLLEVAALLHDVGKIGIPDKVLQKPARLDGSEAKMMEMTGDMGGEMLAAAGATSPLLAIIEQARWDLAKEPILSARMMAIVDAFDSMTTDQVFRGALSHEKAIVELCTHAGTQFDPFLVRQFAEVICSPRGDLDATMAQRWITKFAAERTPGFDCGTMPVSSGAIQNMLDKVFHNRLLDALGDATMYLDAGGQILSWNRAAEKLTGRLACSTLNRTWSSEMIGLVDSDGQPLSGERCPLHAMFQDRSKVSMRCQLVRTDGKRLHAQLTVLPVISECGEFTGVIILLRDASTQANLEEQVQTLNAIATRDPLTGVANRSALDERLTQHIEAAKSLGRRTSVIMCDIDFFKQINDTHGHQAGDEALKAFAQLLGDDEHEADLVARYGGEEFVVLCAGYDNPSATIRAERIRQVIEQTPLPALGGKTITASFGVTEIQQGDDNQTVLARADRALMTAKQGGRNRVVQTGSGWDDSLPASAEGLCPVESESERNAAAQSSSWFKWFRAEQITTQRAYLAFIPQEIAIEKLKGFVADHGAEVLRAESGMVSIRLDCRQRDRARRYGERPAVFVLDIAVQPVQLLVKKTKTYQQCTRFQVTAQPIKARDRRTSIIRGQINLVLQSFQSYLGAQLIDPELAAHIIEPRS
jgi:diguanylate cyclase (GGDEF)-like protein/PAS domain S-box-containing protein